MIVFSAKSQIQLSLLTFCNNHSVAVHSIPTRSSAQECEIGSTNAKIG